MSGNLACQYAVSYPISGEPRERSRLAVCFDAIRASWSALIRTTTRLT